MRAFPAPFARQPYLLHLGLQCYDRSFLQEYCRMAPTPLMVRSTWVSVLRYAPPAHYTQYVMRTAGVPRLCPDLVIALRATWRLSGARVILFILLHALRTWTHGCSWQVVYELWFMSHNHWAVHHESSSR